MATKKKGKKKKVYPGALTLEQFAELCVDTVIKRYRIGKAKREAREDDELTMDNYMTLYCIRQKSTGYYLPIRESGYNNYSMVKPSGCLTPRLFRKVGYARICLDHWLKGICSKYTKEDMAEWQYVPVANRTKDDFDIVPVYVTISKLSVDDIADLDKHDADVKQRIKQLGLTCVKGGK